MTTPLDTPATRWRTDRRHHVLLQRQQAAIRRRRLGLALRPPQKMPLTIGGRVVGRLDGRSAAL